MREYLLVLYYTRCELSEKDNLKVSIRYMYDDFVKTFGDEAVSVKQTSFCRCVRDILGTELRTRDKHDTFYVLDREKIKSSKSEEEKIRVEVLSDKEMHNVIRGYLCSLVGKYSKPTRVPVITMFESFSRFWKLMVSRDTAHGISISVFGKHLASLLGKDTRIKTKTGKVYVLDPRKLFVLMQDALGNSTDHIPV